MDNSDSLTLSSECSVRVDSGADKVCISEDCSLSNPYVCSNCQQSHQHNGSILAVRVAKINQVHNKIKKCHQQSNEIVNQLEVIKNNIVYKLDELMQKYSQTSKIIMSLNKQLQEFEINAQGKKFAHIWNKLKANSHIFEHNLKQSVDICPPNIRKQLMNLIQTLPGESTQRKQVTNHKNNQQQNLSQESITFLEQFSNLFSWLNIEMKNKPNQNIAAQIDALVAHNKSENKIVAKLYQLQDLPEKAQEIYNKILNENSLDIEITNRKALLLKKMKRYPEAYDQLTVLIGLIQDKASPEVYHFHRGEVCRQLGKFHEAMSEFNKCIGKQSVKFKNLDKAMAQVLLKQGKIQQALDLFKKALTHQSINEQTKIQIYEGLYECAKTLIDHNLVIQSLTALHKAKPDQLDFLFKRARQYHELKNYQKAIQDYTVAIEKVSTIPGLYYNRAVQYIFAGQSEQSIPDLKKAIQLDPNFKQAVHLLANTCFQLLQKSQSAEVGQHLKTLAINSYGYSLNFYPTNPGIWHNIGVLQSDENPQKAYECFSKAIQHNPNLIASYIGRIKVSTKLHKDVKLIIKDLNKAIELGDRSLSTFLIKCTLEEEQGLYKEAFETAQLILKVDPQNQIVLNIKKRVMSHLNGSLANEKPIESTQKTGP